MWNFSIPLWDDAMTAPWGETEAKISLVHFPSEFPPLSHLSLEEKLLNLQLSTCDFLQMSRWLEEKKHFLYSFCRKSSKNMAFLCYFSHLATVDSSVTLESLFKIL
jgi:hypothetical protein